jgi:hypothetical protein
MKPALSCIISLLLLTSLLSAAEPSLVPDTPNTAPDYFCTWTLQGFVCSYSGSNDTADAMTEANLFGKGPNRNWVEMYPDARADLILVLDDTWDIPLAPRDGDGRGHSKRGSLELDNQRFPSYTGTPAERLAKLNRDVRARGWRSVGLWVYSGRPKKTADPLVNDEAYWAERMRWCKEAGIDYWKVDWGYMSEKDVWRLNQWAQRAYPGLWIEHGGGAKVTGERVWLADKIGVWRTYDVNPSAAIPETIRRVAVALRHPRQDKSAAGLINCEDEPYIGAGLGCVYGVMRHPLLGNMPSGQPDKWFKPEFRDLKRRLDEVTRAVRWHRIAHPFGVTNRELIDAVLFKESPKHAGAPARIARGGLPLPIVTVPEGKDAPYVLCSRHPDGEIAVATAARKTKAGEIINPADITLEVGELNRPVGIFGKYGSLTLVTTSPLAGKRILAQDLAGKTPVDITGEVKVDGGRLTIPGPVIQRVGLMAAKPGDISDPGLVLAVQGLTKFIAKSPMKPFPGGQRTLPVGEPGSGLKIVRAIWGPVFGGDDVTARVTAMIKDSGLTVEAYPDVYGSTNPSAYQRLEVEYTCLGQGFIAVALYGERLVIDSKGHYRTERSGRKIVDSFDDPATQAKVTVSKYKEQDGGRLLIIRKLEDLTQVNFATERKSIMVVTGTASVISETEYAVTGFNQNSDMEERVELKTLEDGSIQMKRASLPVPETVTFLKAP